MTAIMNSDGGFNNSASNEELECLQQVYKFLEEDEEVKNLRPIAEDDICLMVIRAYDCNASAAWRVLKNMQIIATKMYPDLMARVDPEYLKPILDMGCFQVLHRGTSTGPGVICFRLNRWDESKATPDDLIAAGVLYVYRMAKECVEVQRNGLVVVVDIEGFAFHHVKYASYEMAMKIQYCLTNATPLKMLGYVVVNSHMVFEKTYNVMKYLLPEKTRRNVFICKKYSALYDLVPQEKLPKSLGGPLKESEVWEQNFEDKISRDNELGRLINKFQEYYPELKKFKPKRKN